MLYAKYEKLPFGVEVVVEYGAVEVISGVDSVVESGSVEVTSGVV